MAKKQTSDVTNALTKGLSFEKFQFSEAYKSVRTNLLFTLANTSNKVVVISSPEPDAGKSTTCAYLAQAMAQTGSRVLIIDSDMRKPTQHKLFRLNNNVGLSRLLGGFGDVSESIQRDVSPGLDLISAGPIPPNPSELLGSKQLQDLLDVLSEYYDFIFIDTPPIRVVTDALLIGHLTAGVVLICRQKQTTYDDVKKCIENLAVAKSNLLGIIITDVSERHKPYGQYGNRNNYQQYSYEK